MKTTKGIIALLLLAASVSGFYQAPEKKSDSNFMLGASGGLNTPRLTGGIGYMQNIGFSDIFIDFSGAYGLTTVQKDSNNGNSHIGNLLIALGYYIPL